ncbi:MAG: VWA domain-containing protein [Vicinamibacterales bacterium]
MMRLGLAACLLIPQATFRSGVDAVTVDVSVRDGSRVVTGLRAADFEVFDNGVPQDVASVSYGKLPIDVTLTLDVSLSVTGPLLDRLRQAVRQLMADLGPDDRLRFLGFNMRISRAVDFTADAAKIDEALRSAVAGGSSSIWDALAVALVSASEPERRQLIVVFTDGADNSSITTPAALIDLARRTNASIASVVPGSGSAAGPQARQGLELLRDLASETGGTVIQASGRTTRTAGTRTTITVNAPIDLTATFRRVLDDFRSSYVLHFTPKGVARTGFHTLDVRIKGKRSLTVRARRGYAVR